MSEGQKFSGVINSFRQEEGIKTTDGDRVWQVNVTLDGYDQSSTFWISIEDALHTSVVPREEGLDSNNIVCAVEFKDALIVSTEQHSKSENILNVLKAPRDTLKVIAASPARTLS